MKYLITGSGGQLGREWIEFLRRENIDHQGFNSEGLDITHREMVHDVVASVNPDVVVNCAAYTKVDDAEDHIETAFKVNEKGVQNLISACERVHCKLVHYSTDYVFPGNMGDAETYPGGYPEEAPKQPVNAYGRSKRAGEIALEESNIDYLLIRVSWLCGLYGGNFVKTMLRLAKSRDLLSVVDDQIGSPAFTFDVVEKTERLLRRSLSGVFHISSKGKISWADFAEEIFRQKGINVQLKRVPSEEFPTKAVRPAFSLLSTQKIENQGIKTLDWQSGLSVLLKNLNREG